MSDRGICPTCGGPVEVHTPAHEGDTGWMRHDGTALQAAERVIERLAVSGRYIPCAQCGLCQNIRRGSPACVAALIAAENEAE